MSEASPLEARPIPPAPADGESGLGSAALDRAQAINPEGVHQPGCRFRRVLLASGTIAGLLDGDGSFFLAARGEGERRRYVPQVAYVVRDDDPTPAWVASSVSCLRGAPIGHLRHYPRQRDLGWWVGAVPDIVDLAAFLARAPVLSPRGWLQLTAVREAALLLADGRPRRSATESLTLSEVERLRELHDEIPRADGRVAKPLPLPSIVDKVDNHYLGAYLAGFAAAEGSFGARSTTTHYHRPLFRLTQRIDNIALLEVLRDRLGIGRLVGVKVGRGSPAAQWVVENDDDLDALISLFRTHPLPPGSPKQRALEAWVELLAVRRHVRATRPRGALREDPDLIRLAAEILETRRYRGPWHGCECADTLVGPSGGEGA